MEHAPVPRPRARRRQDDRVASGDAAAAPPRDPRRRESRPRPRARRVGYSRARPRAVPQAGVRRGGFRARPGARRRCRGLPARIRRGLFRPAARGAWRAALLPGRASPGVPGRKPPARSARHSGRSRAQPRAMTARIIDGKAIAAEYRAEYAIRVERLKDRGIVPGLAVVIVGEDPASKIYVRNKALASGAIGMHSEVHALAVDVTQAQLISFVHRLNASDAIHGILVQMPLPKHIDSRAVIEAIAPDKDVDGFHYFNVGSLVAGEPGFYPCTPGAS